MIWDLPKQRIVVELWFDFWLELGFGLGVGSSYKDFIYAPHKN